MFAWCERKTCQETPQIHLQKRILLRLGGDVLCYPSPLRYHLQDTFTPLAVLDFARKTQRTLGYEFL